MKRFYSFCSAYAVFNPFPMSEKLLCSFAAYLAEQNMSHQTIKTYLSAVRDAHISFGFPDFRSADNLPRLERIQAGIRRVQAQKGLKKRVRLPITPQILDGLRRHWAANQEGRLLWAVASLCFFGFFRLGELLATVPDSPSSLVWDDISFDHAHYPAIVKIHLRFAKCDQFGKGADVYIGRSGNSICPIAACLEFVTSRVREPGYFFLDSKKNPLLKPRFATELRKALDAIGQCQHDYAGHSFRIGAATAAAAAGLEDSTIQLLGRWSSAAFLTYIRTPGRQLAAATASISKLG